MSIPPRLPPATLPEHLGSPLFHQNGDEVTPMRSPSCNRVYDCFKNGGCGDTYVNYWLKACFACPPGAVRAADRNDFVVCIDPPKYSEFAIEKLKIQSRVAEEIFQREWEKEMAHGFQPTQYSSK